MDNEGYLTMSTKELLSRLELRFWARVCGSADLTLEQRFGANTVRTAGQSARATVAPTHSPISIRSKMRSVLATLPWCISTATTLVPGSSVCAGRCASTAPPASP